MEHNRAIKIGWVYYLSCQERWDIYFWLNIINLGCSKMGGMKKKSNKNRSKHLRTRSLVAEFLLGKFGLEIPLSRDFNGSTRMLLCFCQWEIYFFSTPFALLSIRGRSLIYYYIFYGNLGLTPSQIGVYLRDQHGVPQVRFVTG